MNNKIWIGMFIISVLVLLLVVLPFILWGADGIDFYTELYELCTVTDPPKPEITYSESPFTFVYELNGEEKVIEDTLICEYDGILVYGGIPNKKIEWEYSLKSGNKRLTLLQIDATNEIYIPLPDLRELKEENGEEVYSIAPYRYDAEDDPQHNRRGFYVSDEELLNKYGIRIISCEMASPPISKQY